MKHRRFYLIVGYCLIILFFWVQLKDMNQDTKETMATYEETNSVSLIAVGDNLIHDTIYKSALSDDQYDFKPIYSDVKPYIKTFDLAFINQETMLGGKEIGLSSYPRFNSPIGVGEAVVDSGFNLISIANNHTLDRGEIAIQNAISFWDSKPVRYSGALTREKDDMVKRFNKNGITFAFVAYTNSTNGIPLPEQKKYLANVFSKEKAQKDIETIREQVDVIIVSMHWGEQYQNKPSNEQIEQANFLSELGVDIIIGHHPHVIQPVDLIERGNHQTLVMYSLGNFLSDQRGIDRLIGMAVSINIEKVVKNDQVMIRLTEPKAKLTHHYFDHTNGTFKVKFFDDLTNQILNDYPSYFERKRELIRSRYKHIEVTY